MSVVNFGNTTTAKVTFNTNGIEYSCDLIVEAIDVQKAYGKLEFDMFDQRMMQITKNRDRIQIKGTITAVDMESVRQLEAALKSKERKVRDVEEFSK